MRITTNDLPPDVPLEYTFPIDGKAEVHAYFKRQDGKMKVHIRLVNINEDGSACAPERIALSPEMVNDLLIAVGLLAAKARSEMRASGEQIEPAEVRDLDSGVE